MGWSYWLGAVGAVLTLGGFVWAWARLYALWRVRWPGEHLMPRLAAWWERHAPRWLRRPKPVTGRIVATLPSLWGTANASVRYPPDATLEERVERIETLIPMIEDNIARQVLSTRQAASQANDEIRTELRERARTDDARARDDARGALVVPALLTAVGAVLHLVAAFLPPMAG